MNNELRTKNGFSLTEVLLSIGILAVGMIFIAGVFPVAIHFATVATERTIAAVAADEAFAKIRLYGVDLNLIPSAGCVDYRFAWRPLPAVFDPNEFAYPSTDGDITQKQYFWSALCRRVGLTDVQVTVFVCRAGAAEQYRDPADPFNRWVRQPMAVSVAVTQGASLDELNIDVAAAVTFINDGYTIVDDQTGDIYRVLERYPPPNDNTIKFDRNWLGGSKVWVIPPAIDGGRYPCVAVYQKVIRF